MTSADVTEVLQRVSALEAQVRLGFEEVTRRLDKGDNRFEELCRRIDSAEEYIAARRALNGYANRQNQAQREELLMKRSKLYDLGLLVVGAVTAGVSGVLFDVIRAMIGGGKL